MSLEMLQLDDPKQPWQALSLGLGFPDEHQAYWWSVIAPRLQKLLEWSNYPLHEQYRVLGFLHRYVLPSCGPRPYADGEMFWKTVVSFDSVPIQWSLNFYDNKATVRLANSPISFIAGSPDDPVNQKASIETLEVLKHVLPEHDLSWFEYFKSVVFLSNKDARSLVAREDPSVRKNCVQATISYDFTESDTQTKVAMCPLLHAVERKVPLGKALFDAIRGYEAELSSYFEALSVLEDYVNSENATLAKPLPVAWAFDTNLKYKKARIKIYVATPRTAFSSMVDLYTLGGRLSGTVMDKAIAALRILWDGVMNLPEGCPDDQDLEPIRPTNGSGAVLNFELSPGAKFPVPQLYLPVAYFGKDNVKIAEGIENFSRSQGWSEPLHSYKDNFLATFTNANNKLTALHHDISFSYKDAGPYLTAYYKPELDVIAEDAGTDSGIQEKTFPNGHVV